MGNPRIRRAARIIRDGDDVVLHTGPGLLSGRSLPGFELASRVWQPDGSGFSLRRFEENPRDVWNDWAEFVETEVAAAGVSPGPAHDSVADLVDEEYVSTVVTETVYGLHRQAGVPASACIEFHGRVDRAACRYCDREHDVPPERIGTDVRCPACGGSLKPGIVLAGEPPAKADRLLAYARAEQCDVYVTAGSRLAVDPTAENPEHAVEKGARLVVIGERPTPFDRDADYRIRENAARVLPRLRDALLVMGEGG